MMRLASPVGTCRRPVKFSSASCHAWGGMFPHGALRLRRTRGAGLAATAGQAILALVLP